MSTSSVLVIAPHPDDAEIGMGGTIAALINGGVEVTIADLTDGEPTPYGSPEIRAQETLKASIALGVTKRRLLGITNREVVDSIENRQKVAAVIREVKPDVLFIPYWEDTHPDHIAACMLCEAARFYSKFVKSSISGTPHYPKKVFHFFSTHIRVKIIPSFIVDVTAHFEKKMDSIGCYESQFKMHPGNAKRLHAIRIEGAFWGDQINTGFGEPFACRENIALRDPALVVDL